MKTSLENILNHRCPWCFNYAKLNTPNKWNQFIISCIYIDIKFWKRTTAKVIVTKLSSNSPSTHCSNAKTMPSIVLRVISEKKQIASRCIESKFPVDKEIFLNKSSCNCIMVRLKLKCCRKMLQMLEVWRTNYEENSIDDDEKNVQFIFRKAWNKCFKLSHRYLQNSIPSFARFLLLSSHVSLHSQKVKFFIRDFRCWLIH